MKRTLVSTLIGLAAVGAVVVASNAPAFADSDSGPGNMAAAAQNANPSPNNYTVTVAVNADSLPCKVSSTGVPQNYSAHIDIKSTVPGGGRTPQTIYSTDVPVSFRYVNMRCVSGSLAWSQTFNRYLTSTYYWVTLSGPGFSHERDVSGN